MRDIHREGRAEVAAHVHPWNTPPLSDDPETMMLNLPPSAQAAKIATITETVTALRGTRPLAFRAGRFGLGSSTVRALIGAGHAIDSSITPFFSWERDHGPSHIGPPLHMYRLSGDRDVRVPDGGALPEVPLSSGYHRGRPSAWTRLQPMLGGAVGRRLHLPGVAARLDVARPVILSPEVHEVRHLYGLARSLIQGGLPFLHAFWHSPSMRPGLSPFCRTAQDLEGLIARVEQLLALLERRASVRFVTISEAVAELGAQSVAAATP